MKKQFRERNIKKKDTSAEVSFYIRKEIYILFWECSVEDKTAARNIFAAVCFILHYIHSSV